MVKLRVFMSLCLRVH